MMLNEEPSIACVKLLKDSWQRLSSSRNKLDQYEFMQLAKDVSFTLKDNLTMEQQTCDLRCFILKQLLKKDETNSTIYRTLLNKERSLGAVQQTLFRSQQCMRKRRDIPV